jgi:hypothetical protein
LTPTSLRRRCLAKSPGARKRPACWRRPLRCSRRRTGRPSSPTSYGRRPSFTESTPGGALIFSISPSPFRSRLSTWRSCGAVQWHEQSRLGIRRTTRSSSSWPCVRVCRWRATTRCCAGGFRASSARPRPSCDGGADRRLRGADRGSLAEAYPNLLIAKADGRQGPLPERLRALVQAAQQAWRLRRELDRRTCPRRWSRVATWPTWRRAGSVSSGGGRTDETTRDASVALVLLAGA